MIVYKIVKKICVIILVFISFSSCEISNEDKGKYVDGYFGRVKSITQFEYNAIEDNGKIIKGSIFKDPFGFSHGSEEKYDNIGNRIERINYNGFYKIDEKYISIFDTKKNEIEYSKYDSNGQLETKIKKRYNNNNLIVEEIELDNNGNLNNKIIIDYDEKQNIVREMTYDKVGEIEREIYYKYDEKGNNIEVKSDAKDAFFGNLGYLIIKKYDSQNRIIQSLRYERYDLKDYVFLNNVKYVYNDTVNSKETIRFNTDGTQEFSVIRKYDENGNVVEQSQQSKNENLKFTYKFDENNNEIEMLRYNSRGKITFKQKYELIYDKKGNIVKEIHFYNDKAEKIVERDIQYFE